MRVSNITSRLIKKAIKSTCRFKIAAIGISKTGAPLICAFNSTRFKRKGGGMHAEMVVLTKAPRSLRTIVICRVNKAGYLLPIKPCAVCMRTAQKLGVKIETISGQR